MMDIHSCRVCLDAASTLISLYEVENDELIVDLLTFCVNIPIIKGFKLPRYICDNCLTSLRTSHEMKSVFLKNDEYLKNILEQDEDHFKQEVYNGEDEYTLEYEPIDEVMEEETFEVESFEEEAIEMEASSLVSYDTEYLEDYLEEQPAPIVVAPNIEPQNKTSKRIQLEKSKLSPKLKSIKIEMAKPKITIRKSTINLNKSDESNTSKIDKKMSCKLCGMVLSRKENLDNHMVVIHKEDPKFCCHICEKGFGASYELKRHLQRIHNTIPLPSLKSTPLKDRKLTAATTVQKPSQVGFSLVGDPLGIPKSNVICFICDAAFDQLRDKIVHIEEQHPDENNCPVCSYTCTGGMALNSHMKKHKVERSIFCKLCNKGFYEMKHLRDHLKFVHPDPSNTIHRIFCELCKSTFQTVSGLRKHQRKFPDCTKMSRKSNKKKIMSPEVSKIEN